ncbi:MAG: cobalt-precorrin-6A reductase [Rhodobacteraceae bacterium]|nr:cobalt-precorrin-6A reductase [Paracoccaceae bacterium]
MPRVLILGGTTEASALAEALAAARIPAVLSYAGRVENPRPQPVPVRTGGFGGAAGLAAWLAGEAITHLVDATHPFAATISAHAAAAARAAGVPLIALTRAPWTPGPGDRWTRVPDLAAAAAALGHAPQRVFLAIGRQGLGAFAAAPQHHYLCRLVDPPAAPLPLPRAEVVIDRGPFSEAGDRALLTGHAITVVVAKNAGGTGAAAKLAAARALGLPVIMVDRPAMPARREATSLAEVLAFIHGDERGV